MIKYKLWKLTYPYICGKCSGFNWEYRGMCEQCGCIGKIREITKKDYKIWKSKRK